MLPLLCNFLLCSRVAPWDLGVIYVTIVVQLFADFSWSNAAAGLLVCCCWSAGLLFHMYNKSRGQPTLFFGALPAACICQSAGGG